jgi:2-methylcitrate dehydratase PrpD
MLSRQLVRSLTAERTAIPERIVRKTWLHILDNLAVMAAATRSPLAQFTATALDAGGSGGAARVMGGRTGLPPAMAAFGNAALAHIMDFDDIHDIAKIHPTSVTLPSALAAAELVPASGRDIIDAVALGNELTCRLGLLLSPTGKGPGADWFLSQLFGYAGGCLAAGLVLGLSEDEMVAALGIAYMQTAGGKEPAFATGADTRGIYTGFAAQGAVQSALLARAGFTGPASAFEGKAGLFPLYFGIALSEDDKSGLLESGRWSWEAANIKPYPCCRSSHPYVAVALDLHRKIAGRRIDRVRIAVNDRASFLCRPLEHRRRPQTLADAKYSIPYMVAFALVHGEVTLTTLVDESLTDQAVWEIADRLEIEVTLPDQRGLAPAEISVEFTDGSSVCARFSGRLDVDDDDLRAKFISCLAYAGHSNAKVCWDRLQKFDGLDARAVFAELGEINSSAS